jgi:HK97 family phage major capsid protein
VRNDLMTVLALAKDLACISGAGAAGEPVGILNTTGVGSITYSAAATWAKVVENETTLFAANVHGTPAFVSSFATQGKWKTAAKVTAQPIYLIESGSANGYKFAATSQMPSGDKSIFGVFSDLIVADWDGIDIVVDPYSLSLGNQVRIVVNLMTDVGIRNPVSFVVSTDSAAQ